jgi:hypothetical protein
VGVCRAVGMGDVMAMPKEKILKVIEENEHITVKSDNRPLIKRLEAMVDEGSVECDYVSTDHKYHYYKAKGSAFRFPRKPSDYDYDPEID